MRFLLPATPHSRQNHAAGPDIPGGRVFQNVDFPERGTSPGSSTPWASILALVGFVGLCLLVGAVDAELAAGSLAAWYLSLTPPPAAPATWLIAPISCTVYALAGLAGWLAWRRVGASAPLRLWGWQLLVSALWVPALFGLHSTLVGLIVILALWPLLLLTLRDFRRLGALSAALMLPYAAWIGFATYLVAGLWWLN